IIDSLLLPKVLDEILTHGGTYTIKDIRIGQRQTDGSYAKIEVRAPSAGALRDVLDAIHDHGATPVAVHDCQTSPADMDGAFPEALPTPTNYRTQTGLGGGGAELGDKEMDRGALTDPEGAAARCTPMAEVRVADRLVVGRQGIRVFPAEQSARQNLFEFMA